MPGTRGRHQYVYFLLSHNRELGYVHEITNRELEALAPYLAQSCPQNKGKIEDVFISME